MLIRSYTSDDRDAVLGLLDRNIPTSFAPEERADLVEYLTVANTGGNGYFVLLHEGAIVGAGGYDIGIDNAHSARISWDVFHPDRQGQGLGKKLLAYRLDRLRTAPHLTQVIVRTSQMAHGFYAKSGFVLEKVVEDFWAPGFDLYRMQLQL